MTKQAKAHAITRLRTLIAFAYGDQAHGGPNRRPEIEELQHQIKDLQEEEVDE